MIGRRYRRSLQFACTAGLARSFLSQWAEGRPGGSAFFRLPGGYDTQSQQDDLETYLS